MLVALQLCPPVSPVTFFPCSCRIIDSCYIRCGFALLLLCANACNLKNVLFFHASNKIVVIHGSFAWCCIYSTGNDSTRERIKRIIRFSMKSSFNETTINININCHQNLKRHVNIRIWAVWNHISPHFQRKAALNAKALIFLLALIVSFEIIPPHIHPHPPSRCSWSKHRVVWIN